MHACDEWMDGWIWVGIGNSTAGPKLIRDREIMEFEIRKLVINKYLVAIHSKQI